MNKFGFIVILDQYRFDTKFCNSKNTRLIGFSLLSQPKILAKQKIILTYICITVMLIVKILQYLIYIFFFSLFLYPLNDHPPACRTRYKKLPTMRYNICEQIICSIDRSHDVHNKTTTNAQTIPNFHMFNCLLFVFVRHLLLLCTPLSPS